jgi:hypothetical protein
MAINNQLTKFYGSSQARIDDHHKPHCGSRLEHNQLLHDLDNDTGYCLLLDDIECCNNKVVLSLVSYTSSVILREMLRELQILKIENNVSIPRV